MHKSLIGLAARSQHWPCHIGRPSTANAYCFGCAVGAGVLGGVVAGAIVGSAIANSPPPPPLTIRHRRPATIHRRRRRRRIIRLRRLRRAPIAAPPPAYAQLAPGCHWAKRRVWVEGVGLPGADRAGLSLRLPVAQQRAEFGRPAHDSRPVCFCARAIVPVATRRIATVAMRHLPI